MIRFALRTVFGLHGRDLLTVKMFSSPTRGHTPASAVRRGRNRARASQRGANGHFPGWGFQAGSLGRDSDD